MDLHKGVRVKLAGEQACKYKKNSERTVVFLFFVFFKRCLVYLTFMYNATVLKSTWNVRVANSALSAWGGVCVYAAPCTTSTCTLVLILCTALFFLQADSMVPRDV